MGEILAGEIRGAQTVTREEMAARFQQRLEKMGVEYDPRAAQRLARYHEMLAEWNARVNLIADTEFEPALDRHYIDSLAPLSLPELFPQKAKVIDVGSGAGFPGLPLAIVRPDLTVLLLDSLAKRVKFLEAVVVELRLTNVRVLHARAEDAGRNPFYRERFDVAAARAVAPASVLMELLLPFVRTGGRTVCYKGPAVVDELLAGCRAAALLGGSALQTLPVTVPDQPEWRHCVLVSVKRRPTAATYPRRAGEPARAPLGSE